MAALLVGLQRHIAAPDGRPEPRILELLGIQAARGSRRLAWKGQSLSLGSGPNADSMSFDWCSFEFAFTLDMARLLPHLAAIEAGKAATLLGIIPPQWREKSKEEAEAALRQIVIAHKDTLENEIRTRKIALVLANAGQAHKWVKERFAAGNAPMRLEDILCMHRMAAEEAGIRSNTAGVMRKEGRQVTTGSEEIGFHQGAPGSRVLELMNQYVEFINDRRLASLPPIIHALVAQFFFTTIHPFEDGNGRVSRLISAAILYQRGYNGHGLYALSNHFYENEERYHRLLFKQQQDRCLDLTEFFAFGMEGLALELQGINNFIKVKLNRVLERKSFVAKGSRRRSR